MSATQVDSSSDFVEFARLCKKVESTRSKLAKVEFVANYFVKLSLEDLRNRKYPPIREDLCSGSRVTGNQCRLFSDLEDSSLPITV